MSGQGAFGVAVYGAPPPLGEWPNARDVPESSPVDFGPMLEQFARFPTPPKPMPATAAEIVREQIERLVRLRLSLAIGDAGGRAELDAVIGALTVAVSVP